MALEIIVHIGSRWRTCDPVTELLSREGHPFLTKNVSEVDGRAIEGFDEPALRNALAIPSES